MTKKVKLTSLALTALLFLSACSRQGLSPITEHSKGFWSQFVYFFAVVIEKMSFGNIGIGIILFTIVIRLLLLPLYNKQIQSSREMQDLQPKLRAIQAQFPGRDAESRLAMTEATNALYKEHGINPYASLWPVLVQMPILIGLYQALLRVDFLQKGSFLWFSLSKPDPYYILPILAALFTFLSTWLTNKGAREKNIALTVMSFVMPVLIFFFALSVASGVSLYWAVSNALQVVQTLLFNNPFKLIAEREQAERAEKEKAARIRRAKKKAHKRK